MKKELDDKHMDNIKLFKEKKKEDAGHGDGGAHKHVTNKADELKWFLGHNRLVEKKSKALGVLDKVRIILLV